jgi:hypothetical protein
VAEWSIAAVLKTVVPLRVPWVRILPPPPIISDQAVTEPGIFVPTEVRDNPLKERSGHANSEVQTRASGHDVAS